MTAELDALRQETEPKRRIGSCADCGKPREVYFQVGINDAGAKTEGRNYVRLKSGSLVLCAACAVRRFDAIFANGETP